MSELPTVFFWGRVVDPVKLLAERPHVRKASFQRDIQNALFCVGKKAAGMRQTDAVQVLLEGQPQLFPKKAG